MNLVEVLQLKFPNADFLYDIRLAEYGNGPEIQLWNTSLLGAKPTQKDLDAWAIELQPQYEAKQKEIANTPIYEALKDVDLRSIRALRESNRTKIQELESEAATLRGQLL